jgi:2-amino-4-ketopentanoate thiolase alpha subunit
MTAKRGDWVEVARVILTPAERAPGLPEDTSKVPYTLRVRGIALSDGEMGEKITVRTQAGREVEGELLAVNPGFEHTFGGCVPEIVEIRSRLKRLARGEDQA